MTQEAISEERASMVGDLFLKNTHAFRDAHHDHLHQIDLHEDENLVQCAENVPHRRHVNPFCLVVAHYVHLVTLGSLSVQNESASEDGQRTQNSKNDVNVKQTSGLFRE